jgi:hypothetical protein
MSTEKTTQRDTIICPYCNQVTTASAYFLGEVIKWKIDFASVNHDEPEVDPPTFSCDKCEREIDEDSLEELWKACHDNPKRIGVGRTTADQKAGAGSKGSARRRHSSLNTR